MPFSQSKTWCILFFVIALGNATQHNAIIPAYSGGRFGDNLLAFAHALFLAQQHNLKLLLPPFTYSNELAMDKLLPAYTAATQKQFKQVITVERNTPLATRNERALFILPYFPEAAIFQAPESSPFITDWKNPSFKALLRKYIAPQKKLTLVTLPQDMVSIAVHVRKGGSFADESYISSGINMEKLLEGNHIYKLPLDDYYIEQIKTVSRLYNGKPLYVFLFTDDKNPQKLVEKYRSAVNIPCITFACRTETNDHCFNVLEDFFSMAEFDVLIRPESNFSIMAEKIGDHHLIISPGPFLPNTTIQSGIITTR